MYEIYPYFTNDGSVGLFNPDVQDIYHSTYGALREAYEKFILPAELDEFFKSHNEIKILDICFGIGYNSKSFLNFLFEKKYFNFSKKNLSKIDTTNSNIASIYANNTNCYNYSDKIDNDNITQKVPQDFCNYEIYSNNNTVEKFTGGSNQNNESIYSNNFDNKSKPKIYIKALDTDKNLFCLSPFIRQGSEKDKKRYNKLNFNYEKISKLLDGKFEEKYRLNYEVNLLIFKYILKHMPDIFENPDVIRILNDKNYNPFFDKEMVALFECLRYKGDKYTPLRRLFAFLHNIYYRYLSRRYKNYLNNLISDDFIFEPVVGDARLSLKNDNKLYNYIFLDAFTPAKCPALWSLDFFKLLFEHLEEDGMILTYSNSAAVRNAMLNAGFYVGKIYNENANKFTGTIATKNKSLIKFELSEYDLGLINSKAGIFYRDKNLNASNDEIIAYHKIEVQNSDKISSSSIVKKFKRNSHS